MKLPRFTLRDLFWLVLVASAPLPFAHADPPKSKEKTPKYASTYRLRGSCETQNFLAWSHSRHPAFAFVELDEAGNATYLSVHICVSITDDDIDQVRQLNALESVTAYGAQLTDDGLSRLAELKSLRRIEIFGAKHVSDETIARLRKARPDLKLELTYRD